MLPKNLNNVRIHRTQVRKGTHGEHADAEHSLGETGRPGGGLRVSDTLLHSLKHERVANIAPRHKNRGRRANLNRVAERCARAVHLEHIHIGARDARVTRCTEHHRLLRRAIRRSE